MMEQYLTTQLFTKEEDVFTWMDQVCKPAILPGLERVEWLLERLHHPERRCKFIHIAGTNGKGSTAAMLSSVLQEAGYKTGLFVSPSVIRWNERIQVDGEYISEESFVKWANKLKPLIEKMKETEIGPPSPFEFYTVLALCYFAFDAVPWFVVWETGLGGRCDATNVVSPLVSVITRIGLDHQEWLGTNVENIAREKAGIIKPGVPVVCSRQISEVACVLHEKALECKSPYFQSGVHFNVTPLSTTEEEKGQKFQFSSVYRTYSELILPLLGLHQLQNVATVIMTLEVLQHQYAMVIDEDKLASGLKNVQWPGRIEIVDLNPFIILDGAHNEDSMEVLVDTLKRSFSYNKLYVMIAMMKDKDVERMFSQLLPVADKIITTEIIDEPRSYKAEKLAELIQNHKNGNDNILAMQSPMDGIGQLKEWATKDDLILITGSLYLISEIRKYLIT